ncbi:MAG: DUF3137 domain-containing protein [Leptospiraceae bacterium]|nr:DUF3137 domain-containing protein [Leptospiraceae bacterium]
MKSYYDLYKELHKDLLKLDEERIRKLYFVIPVGLFCFGGFFYFDGMYDLLVFGIPDFKSLFGIWSLLSLIGSLIFLYWVYIKLKEYMREYQIRFKKIIILPILSSLADEVVHFPARKFNSLSDIYNSGFVFERPDGVRGEDLVKGKIEGIQFSFSEVEVYKMVETKNGKSEKTILEGIFFVANFPKRIANEVNIRGKARLVSITELSIFKHLPTKVILVLAATFIGLFSFILYTYSWLEIRKFLSKRFFVLMIVGGATLKYVFTSISNKVNIIFDNFSLKRIKTANVHFEKNYSIYSRIATDANLLKFKEVQDAFISFQKKTSTSASIHIRNEKVYIFIPKSFDIFEPKWLKKNTDPKVIQESYDIMKDFYDIVVALKLALNIK